MPGVVKEFFDINDRVLGLIAPLCFVCIYVFLRCTNRHSFYKLFECECSYTFVIKACVVDDRSCVEREKFDLLRGQ